MEDREFTFRDEISNAPGAVGAFILGAAVGAAVALLYAPAEGRYTRGRISDKAREAAGRVKASSQRLADQTREAAQHLTEKAQSMFPGGTAGQA